MSSIVGKFIYDIDLDRIYEIVGTGRNGIIVWIGDNYMVIKGSLEYFQKAFILLDDLS